MRVRAFFLVLFFLQEGIPALVADSIVNGDKKMSYYREHTHALASGVDAGRVMGELFAKDGGTCRGAGGSMHVYDKDTHFQVRRPPSPTSPHSSVRCDESSEIGSVE